MTLTITQTIITLSQTILLFTTLRLLFAVLQYHLWHLLCKIKICFLSSIYHLWFDTNVRQWKIAIIHYDWGNIRSGNFALSGSNPVGEVSIGEVFVGGSVSRRSVFGEQSVRELSSWGSVLQSININNVLGNLLKKCVSIIVSLCPWCFTKGPGYWSFYRAL